ncbi:MAG TPA: ABC transporter transmembrane domain-containing protein, partial [Thermoanaerobaculia bacterium]
MKVLRRLYRYLSQYKAWAALAFGSMIIFAVTQTAMIGLVQPIFDSLAQPTANAKEGAHASREEAFKSRVTDIVLKRDLPEGQRGWIINQLDDVSHRFHGWWDAASHKMQFRRLLAALLLVFVVRAVASFYSEYAFQKVGLSTVRDLRNELYERLIHQSHRFFSERSTGEMVSRVVSDADAIQAAVSTRMGDLFQESLTLLFLLLYVVYMD